MPPRDNEKTKEDKIRETGEKLERNLGRVEKAATAMVGMQGNVQKGLQTGGKIAGDIGDIVTDVKRKASAAAGTYGSSSIIGKASKNVFEFPVFMSSSIPIDFATATNSLLEQIYASYLQMAISQTPVISKEELDSGNVFQNMKSDVTKYLEYTDMFYAHDACHNIIDSGDAVFEYHMITVPDKMNDVIMEQLNYQPLSEFDHFFQEAKHNHRGNYRRLREQQMRDEHDAAERQKVRELEDKLDRKKRRDREDERHRKDEEDRETRRVNEARRAERDEYTFQQNEIDRETRRAKDDIDFQHQYGVQQYERNEDGTIKKDKDGNPIVKKNDNGFTTRGDREEERELRREERNEAKFKLDVRNDTEKHAMDMKMKAPQILDETKIQKLNTMKPLMMTVGVKVKDQGYISDAIDFIVGVKTHCRVVPADVLPDVAEYPNKGQNLLSRKARWRAGEIKFLDYLFSRKEKKQAAYDSKDPNRKWYHRLYTLAHSKGSSRVAKQVTGKRSPDGLIPNATIVMTKADVDMIEATNGIDLLKGSEAAHLCRELFLIAMVVIDTDAQSIKILLPDVNNDYEVHSLASVNKQLATLDTSNAVSREVTKMMHGR